MRAIAVVGIRILGAYTVLSNLGLLATFLAMPVVTGDLRDVVWPPLVPPAVMVLLGVAMLLFSRRLAALAFDGIPDAPTPRFESERLLGVGTSLIGIFLVAMSLSPLVVSGFQFFALGDVSKTDDLALRIEQQGVIASFARALGAIIIGLLLLRMSAHFSSPRQSAPA